MSRVGKSGKVNGIQVVEGLVWVKDLGRVLFSQELVKNLSRDSCD